MLTNEDIVKLSKVLATKQDITELRADVSEVRETSRVLVTSIDRLTTKLEKYIEEQII